MSLQNVAHHLAAYGRSGDTELVHMNREEVAGLRALAHKHGIEMPTNPYTGLPEASWLSKLLKNPIVDTLGGAALAFFAPELMGTIGFGSTAAGAGLTVGAASGLASGNLSQGIMSGLGAYGGASLLGGVMGAGESSLANSALQNNADYSALQKGAIDTVTGGGQLSSDQIANLNKAYADSLSGASGLDKLSAGASDITSSGTNAANFAKSNWKPALAAALPVLQSVQGGTTTKMPTTSQSPQYITPYSYDPYTHGLTSLGAYQANTSGSGPGYTRLAEGGIAKFGLGGGVLADIAAAIQSSGGGISQAVNNGNPSDTNQVLTGGMSGPSLDAYRYLMGQSNSPTRGGLGAIAQQNQFSNWQPQAAAAAQSNSAGPGGGAGGSGGGTDLSVVDAGATDQNLGSDLSQPSDDNSYSGGVLQSLIGQNSPAPVEDAKPSVVNDPSVLESMTPPAPTELTPARDGSQAPVAQLDTPPSAMNAASAAFVPPAAAPDPYTQLASISSTIANSPAVQASGYASTPAAPAAAPTPAPDAQVINPYVPPVDSSLAGYNYSAGPFENGGFGPGDANGGGDFGGDYVGGGGFGGKYAIEAYARGGLSAGASHASALRGPLTSLHGVEHLMQYAHGGSTPYADGQYNLGGYSDGGRLLRGPGDGVSDSIPATIGNKQPARLADGEFVVPARIVSELGNGSTEAGARKLYAMMDRIQKARSNTVGKGRVAVNNKADKYLPA